jgi:predicted Zn-dependent protease
LNFSRDMEREADRIGWGVFDAAGFAPSGMASMFDLLERASRLNDGGSFPYLRTHPLTVERLAEARSRLPPQLAAETPAGSQPAQPGTAASVAARAWAPVTAHDLMRARAAVLMTPSAPAWQDLLLRAGPSGGSVADPMAVYAGALAAMKLGNPATATRLVQGLWEAVSAPSGAGSAPSSSSSLKPSASASASTSPSSSPPTAALLVALLRAELAMASMTADRFEQARAWLDRADALAQASTTSPIDGEGPWGRARMMLRAELAVAAIPVASAAAGQQGPAAAQALPKDARQVLDRLRTWVSARPADALAWEWIGRLEQAQGRALRAQRALAEAQVVRGDLDGAIDRLRAAQAASRAPGAAQDFIEASIIDARLRLWMALRRELAGSLRGPGSGSR